MLLRARVCVHIFGVCKREWETDSEWLGFGICCMLRIWSFTHFGHCQSNLRNAQVRRIKKEREGENNRNSIQFITSGLDLVLMPKNSRRHKKRKLLMCCLCRRDNGRRSSQTPEKWIKYRFFPSFDFFFYFVRHRFVAIRMLLSLVSNIFFFFYAVVVVLGFISFGHGHEKR